MINIPIIDLFENLENFYIQKIDYIENSNIRENIKLNELENVRQMATYYKLENVFILAQDAIERINRIEC